MHTSHFIASTGVLGEPNVLVNPPAPYESRARGDAWVHHIEDGSTEEYLIRFWFPERNSDRVLPIDFEILKPVVSWLKNKPLRLTPDVTIKLISMVFFQELTEDFYQEKFDILSFQELGNSTIFKVPYPKARISKHEIA